MGIVEEVGELAHSVLKQSQGIRGSNEEHEENIQDALGDIFLFLCGFSNRKGYDRSGIIRKTWEEVKKRDWTKERRENLERESLKEDSAETNERSE